MGDLGPQSAENKQPEEVRAPGMGQQSDIPGRSSKQRYEQVPVGTSQRSESINPAAGGQPETGDSVGTPEQYDKMASRSRVRVSGFRLLEEIAYATGLLFGLLCLSRVAYWLIIAMPIPVVDEILGVAGIFGLIVGVVLYVYYMTAAIAIAILLTEDRHRRTHMSPSFMKNERDSAVQNNERRGGQDGLPTPK